MALTALVLAMVACTSSATTTTFELVPPPPIPEESTSTTISSITLPRDGPFTPPIQGFFPDGTDFIIKLRANQAERVTRITASILYEADAAIWDVGEVRFLPGTPGDTPSYIDGILRLQLSNQWHVQIEFSADFLDFLGPQADEVVTTGITNGLSDSGFPILDLAAPFRWSTQYDPLEPMQVRFESFLVTLGCDDDALACHAKETMQVKALPGADTPELTIESFIHRPISDPNYLDLGPLSARNGSDVLWTGEEMIVWGGTFADGAAFNPETDTWRLLAEAPFPERTQSDAVWAGDEMIVVTTEGTFGYDPAADSWREVSDYASLEGDHPQMTWVMGNVFVWFNSTLIQSDIDSGTWSEIADPDLGNGQPWSVHMTEWQGRLLVSSNPSDRCFGHEYWVWDGDTWEELPHVSLQWSDQLSDCSMANQVAVIGDEILVWADEDYFTKLYRDGEWVQVERIPGGGAESPPSALVIGDRALVGDGQALIYDPATDTWVTEPMPGPVRSGKEWVWTGEEVLAWFDAPRDAWRWTPPE